MNKKILILALIIVVLNVGFLFKGAIFSFYNMTAKNLQNFEKNDLGAIVDELKKEILAPAPLNVGGSANNSVLLASKVIIETNRHRQENTPPLLTLVENPRLTAAAKAKAEDMFASQYFEHVSPSGVDPGQLVKNHGYDYISTGENLILGNFKDEKEVVQHWMDSPGHRANILNMRFTEIGVAVVKGKYKGQMAWVGVQEFGLPLSSCDQPGENLKNQIEKNKSALDIQAAQIEAKRAQINNTNQRSEKYNQLVGEYNAMVAKYNLLNDATKSLITEYNAQVNVFNKCVAGSK